MQIAIIFIIEENHMQIWKYKIQIKNKANKKNLEKKDKHFVKQNNPKI